MHSCVHSASCDSGVLLSYTMIALTVKRSPSSPLHFIHSDVFGFHGHASSSKHSRTPQHTGNTRESFLMYFLRSCLFQGVLLRSAITACVVCTVLHMDMNSFFIGMHCYNKTKFNASMALHSVALLVVFISLHWRRPLRRGLGVCGDRRQCQVSKCVLYDGGTGCSSEFDNAFSSHFWSFACTIGAITIFDRVWLGLGVCGIGRRCQVSKYVPYTQQACMVLTHGFCEHDRILFVG